MPFWASAQLQSTHLWQGISLRKDIKDFRVSLDNELRSSIPLHSGLYLAEAGLRYNFGEYLSATQAYRFIKERTAGTNINYHRLTTDIGLDYDIRRFSFENRVRYQYKTPARSGYRPAGHVLREKVEAAYNIYRTPFSPFVNLELFYEIRDKRIDRYHISAGTEIYLGPRTELDIGIRIKQYPYNSPPQTKRILISRFAFAL